MVVINVYKVELYTYICPLPKKAGIYFYPKRMVFAHAFFNCYERKICLSNIVNGNEMQISYIVLKLNNNSYSIII